jgi:iron complex outermembrane receptor protein
VSFKYVEINAKKVELSLIGKKTEWMDSTIKQQFRYASVADLISYNSSVFIKSYGPGGIATTALRGANAAQTAILWNGFNLQNAMLAQTDLALLPAVLFEDVGVEYGGSSSQWGSGAIGGGIHLNNKHAFNQGLQSSMHLGAGSFMSLNGSASVLVSRPKFISSTKLYSNSSENNFAYRDKLDLNTWKEQRNASYHFKGLMQEFKFLVGARHLISVNAWISSNQRKIPDYNRYYPSRAIQGDESIRLTGNWSYVRGKRKHILRGAYLSDAIDYTDRRIQLVSLSKVNTAMLEQENYFTFSKNYQFNVALNAQSSFARTDNYGGAKELHRVSLLLGNKFSFLNERLIAYVSTRIEYFSVGALPVTGNVSLAYRAGKHIELKVNTAKVYRQPSLNELYWLQGGNINLKPEQGYTYEGEAIFTKTIKRFSLSVSGSAYSRKIENWILWVPGANGNPSPVNIQNVWSRGTETSWKLRYEKNKFRLGLSVVSGYVLSTVISSAQQNDNSVDKQLIYTPRYNFNTNIMFGYKRTDLVVYHQYNGYRFTTSDNLNWLTPYQVISVRLNHKRVLKKLSLTFFVACHNLLNQEYQIVAGRPMPLRNYEVGISIQLKKQTNK